MSNEKIYRILFENPHFSNRESRSKELFELTKESIIINGQDKYFLDTLNRNFNISNIDIPVSLIIRNFNLNELKIDDVKLLKGLIIEETTIKSELLLRKVSLEDNLFLSTVESSGIFLNQILLNNSSVYINNTISNKKPLRIHSIEICKKFEINKSEIYRIDAVDRHGNDTNSTIGLGCSYLKIAETKILKETDIGYILKDTSKVILDTIEADSISFNPINIVGDINTFKLSNSTISHISINSKRCEHLEFINNTIDSLKASVENARDFNITDHIPSETTLRKYINLEIGAENVSLTNIHLYEDISFTNIHSIRKRLILKGISLLTLKFVSTKPNAITPCKIHLENIHKSISKDDYPKLPKSIKRHPIFIKKNPFFRKGIILIIKDVKIENNLNMQNSTISTICDSFESYVSTLNLLNVTFKNIPFQKVALFEKKKPFLENGDINLSNCSFLEFKDDKAQTIYKKLKKICISNDYDYGTHLFHSLELQSRYKTLKRFSFEQFVSFFSKYMNNYGESISHPIIWYGLVTLLFSATYLYLDGLDPTQGVSQIPWLVSFIQKPFHYCQYLFYSFFNSILIFRFTDIGKIIHPNSLCVQLIAIFQTTISSILLYLFIVGIKKRFRQK